METQAPYLIAIAPPPEVAPAPMPDADWDSLIATAPAPEPVQIITLENGNGLPAGWLRLYVLGEGDTPAHYLEPGTRIAYLLPSVLGGWQMFVPQDQEAGEM